MKRDSTPGKARVLIVDDHPAVREAPAIRIGGQSDLEVCGEAADAPERFDCSPERNRMPPSSTFR